MRLDTIGYARVSVKDQSRYSLEYQESAITHFCKVNNLNLLSIFKDNGESSYTFDRPDWKALEKYIQKMGTVKYLIIFDHDRFSRNLVEALLKIKELSEKYDVTILSTKESLDTDATDTNTYMSRVFKLMMSETELMNIRSRTKAGIYQAAESGYFPNMAPFGYTNVRTPEGKPTLQIDPLRGPVVRKIFRLYAKGLNPVAIKKQVGKAFTLTSRSAIQEMVRNPVYMGMVKVKAYNKIPEHYVKGKHKGIVTEREFADAQLDVKTVKIQQKTDVALRGVLKCECGRHMTAGNSKSRSGAYYWYYLCNTHKKNFSATKLHRQMDEILEELSFGPEDAEAIRTGLTSRIEKMLSKGAEEIGAIRHRIQGVNAKIKQAEKRYLSNQNISENTFREMIGELKDEREALENKLSSISATQADYTRQMNILLPKLLDLKSAYHMMDVARKQRFLSIIFGPDLTYINSYYRTNNLNPLFKHKLLILKEKGLLISNPENEKETLSPVRIGERTSIEHIRELFVAFAS